MKRVCTLMMLVFCLVAGRQGAALEWEASTSLAVMPRPGIGGLEGWVKARSTHRVAVTKISVLDMVFPIQFRIDRGDLLHDAAPMLGCKTAWVWAAYQFSALCVMSYAQDPCEDGVWDAVTVGRLRGHPVGGVKVDFATPQFVDCECV